ncbi:hypothetical protein M5K25_024867 [Dendrobium thyrsiflorum]|uniref:Secreted protein n=1 Tax=Dendrobium thyrsiflorum TaxID=117978 RepID=A0ABD0U381_DENTH
MKGRCDLLVVVMKFYVSFSSGSSHKGITGSRLQRPLKLRIFSLISFNLAFANENCTRYNKSYIIHSIDEAIHKEDIGCHFVTCSRM